MEYVVIAYQYGGVVCEVGTLGAALPAEMATGFARELRAEFPGAIVAITPRASYVSPF
ncbi:hypothetical protein [Streptomyces sp. NPDC048172]|uniref:hypothetical protein n=1 Tax=Streptomyces sp. NPDC048172 TaxID=3365505 RepID=UPI0037159954